MAKKLNAVCFGEILFDVFPDKERIGGAPLNVALRLSSLGVTTEMISKVGDDLKGEELLAYLKANNIITENIEKDPSFETGKVKVQLSASGSATYTIDYPVAWDKIEATEAMEKSVKEADFFVFGSLVNRDDKSRESLFRLLPQGRYNILDLNLRPPHYSKELLIKLLEYTDFIKFNDDELYEVAAMLGSKYHSLEQNLLFMAVKFPDRSICVTKGAYGAVLMHDKKLYYNSGYRVQVKDTVGAGDSFLATLLANLLGEENPQHALDRACAMGALVASEEGATPEITSERLEKFIDPMAKD